MIPAALSLIAVGLAIAMPATMLARVLGRRMNALDGAGVAGQVKAAARPVPNTGGIGIFAGIALPMTLGLIALNLFGGRIAEQVPSLAPHLPGIADQTLPAIVLLLCLGVLHVMGLIDDRRPLGPRLKMAVMLLAATAAVIGTGSRLLTLLDQYPGGAILSAIVTILWIVFVTNALNFLDNMDGLSGGVGLIAGSCFLAAALINGQWFVASCLSLLVGSLAGFLVFNFPWTKSRPASIFMGDGGSLIVGFFLGFLTVRTTYYTPGLAGGWYAVLMPVVVLAVPLYDALSVTIIRLRAGRSPLVGDLNHLSHRLVRRGLSRRDAVLAIHGLTGITALGGIALGSLQPWQAALVGAQTLLVLGVLALYEGRVTSPTAPTSPAVREAAAGGEP